MFCDKKSSSSLASELFDSCPNCVQNRQGHPHSKRHRIKSPSPARSMTKHSTIDQNISAFALSGFDDAKDDMWASLSDTDFYGEVNSPSNDIWNMFDLGMPTPPSSPLRDDLEDEDISSILDSNVDFAKLNNQLIQDCMWSATSPVPDPNPKAQSSKKAFSPVDRARTGSSSGDVPNSSECVDPTSVFPYPLSAEAKNPLTAGHSSVLDTPSPSESEDEEEIDVVTVPSSAIVRKSSRVTSSVTRNLESASAHVAAMHNYSHASHSHHSDHHYSAPYSTQSAPSTPQIAAGVSVLKRSRPASTPTSPQPPFKKQRTSDHQDHHQLKKACQRLYSSKKQSGGRGHSSRTSSDSEEGEGKRTQHNVLERKRRNDLKYSFCTLRACVPDISSAERTPKVTILKKASEYINGLKRRSTSLDLDLARQRHKHEQLRQKLAQLKEDDLYDDLCLF